MSEFGDSVYESGDAVDDLDDDPQSGLTGDDPDADQQTGYSPPDREPYELRHPLTGADERYGRSLDDRLAEESATDEPVDAQRAGRLVAPDAGSGFDDESDAIAEDVGPAGYASSAEEAAMHVIDEP